ncbi:MAG: chemotaxis protein CheW [Planctomycetota bacterium]
MDEPDLLNEFVAEAREHLGDIEIQLLQIEAMGEAINDGLVNTVFRAIHSVKGAAGFLGLTQINGVSHRLENVLGKVRDKKLIPDPYNVDVMLKAADRLKQLIESIESSNETDNTELCERLDKILDEEVASVATADEASEDDEAETVVINAESEEIEAEAVSESAESESARPSEPRKSSAKAKSTPGKSNAVKKRVESKLDDATELLDEAQGKKQSAKAATSASTSDSSTASVRRATAPAPESTIRVGVRVLDRLMNLAGELVLSRNQLMQAIAGASQQNQAMADQGTAASNRVGNLDAIAAGLDQVTTELQESIMQTRMQPIGNVFNKFPRIIRDLSASLGKQIQLRTEGNEVETDKTIVEAIADPLTHLIRNSCDHGVETPEVRTAAGKSASGTVILRAYHQAGKVMIEIIDDGAGIDPNRLKSRAIEKGILDADAAARMSDREAVNLIFAPGFSTAAVVTDVSGRGVGMDVVRTNIEKIGGGVEVTSELGQGSTVRITLPLTLAIVPSMIVGVGDRRYALPQSSIVELVQTDGKEKCIQRANQAEVLRLRGTLLPLVRLRQILGNPCDSSESDLDDCQLVVVETGHCKFAMAVDRVLDSEEIVVKPLGRHLSNLPLLAGSTILGDGRVAMILDTAGIASRIDLATESASDEDLPGERQPGDVAQDVQRMVLLSVSNRDRFAVSMDIVSRIERVEADRIEMLGERPAMQYRGSTLPLISIDEVVKVSEVDRPKQVHIIVFRVYGREVGLISPHLHDICDSDLTSGVQMIRDEGVAGIAVIQETSTRLLDLYGLTKVARPDWFEVTGSDDEQVQRSARILVCEDSTFFRTFLTRTLADEGHKITSVENGELGWCELAEHPDDFDMLMTDIEMPELDGIELTRRVRADGRFDELPIIALSSLADEESTARGRAAGVDDYQVKMNKPALLASIQSLIAKKMETVEA